jgi:Domain of unknown function (DUF4338)
MARDGKDKIQSGETRVIRPSLPPKTMLLVNAFIDAHASLPSVELAQKLRKVHADWQGEDWSLQLRGVALVIADLLDQGWSVSTAGATIELCPPGLRSTKETADEANARIRAALRLARERQLQEHGVRSFVERVERPFKRGVAKTSIADVIEDGAALAADLRLIASHERDQRLELLKQQIKPEVQLCDDSAKCEVTGLRLMDVWRYFRHTWSLEYRSIPGRQLPILIRNGARPNKPVMGIAMLASPVVRTKPRDHWIGWVPEVLIERVSSGAWDANQVFEMLDVRLTRSISELRTDDLAAQEELSDPTERAILRIEQRAAGAAHLRQRKLQSAYSEMVASESGIKSDRGDRNIEDTDLLALSGDPLFLHKRADTLWKLLAAKRELALAAQQAKGANRFWALAKSENGRRAISTAIAEVRKAGLASEVVDLSVCGAAPPYGALLGGKLAALVAASEEVRNLYAKRYAHQPSIISSQMAGRLVVRPADLKILTTTSLYGNNSSQYNRLHIKANEHPELIHDVQWRRLARTEGFGTFHLAPATLRVLREISEASRGARWVNNRFGEGASPRLRQSREGLDALGIDSNSVLHHATPRLFYGCELTETAIPDLMGFSINGVRKAASVDAIATAWMRRWLVDRVTNEETLMKVASSNASTVAADLRSADD